MIRYLFPFFAFLLLIILFIVGLQYDPRLVPSPLIDKPVPEFELPKLHDAQSSIRSSELQGEVTMLNVWASWCLSCRDEHPLLIELAENKEIDIYGLNYKDNRQDAIHWLEYFGDPYVMSAFDKQGKVGIDFGVYGVPETYLIDHDGIIRYKHIGPITREVLESTILPLIKRLKKGSSLKI